ncbi:MAG: hypothetical protein ACPGU1_05365 [Myxococcota bacterium]
MNAERSFRPPRLRASFTAFGLLILGWALGHCGAEGLDAPFTPSAEVCPDIDAHLEPLLGLASEGRLPHLNEVLSSDLSDVDREATVALLFTLAGSLDFEGEGARPGQAVDDDTVREVEEGLANLSRWVHREGPNAPYLTTIAHLSVALDSTACEGDTLSYMASELLADEALLWALLGAASDPGLDVKQLLDDLEAPDDDPHSGLRELVRNLLETALRPDFDVRDWTGLLGLILDTEAPPWSALISALESFLVPGPHLVALQSLLGCVVDVDPELTSSGVLYDLLTQPPEGSFSRLAGNSGEVLLPPALSEAVLSVLATFIEDAPSRSTMAMLMAALIAPDRVDGILSDMTLLFDTGVLLPLRDVLRAMSTRSCGL